MYTVAVDIGGTFTDVVVFDQASGLEERQKQMARSLSGGEQQMCALARGLMSDPKLLLIDEPFIGLSPALRKEVSAAIRRVNAAGVAILLIEQNVAEALRLSHRAYVLREGRVALEDASQALRGTDRVEQIFLGRSSVAGNATPGVERLGVSEGPRR